MLLTVFPNLLNLENINRYANKNAKSYFSKNIVVKRYFMLELCNVI